jgi:uncharacterized paraquat-inducible protein A
MGNRACPLCFGRVPRTLVLTRADELVCPSCHTPLELSRSSRVFSSLVGLLVAVQILLRAATTSSWALPVLGAILAYSLASALALFFLSDLVALPKPSAGHFPHSHK